MTTVLTCVRARHDVEMDVTAHGVDVHLSNEPRLASVYQPSPPVFRCLTCGYGCRVGPSLAGRVVSTALAMRSPQ